MHDHLSKPYKNETRNLCMVILGCHGGSILGNMQNNVCLQRFLFQFADECSVLVNLVSHSRHANFLIANVPGSLHSLHFEFWYG